MHASGDVLGPTSPGLCDPPLGTVFVSRGCWLRGLTQSADQLLERFGVAILSGDWSE